MGKRRGGGFLRRALLAARHLPEVDPVDIAAAAEALGDAGERLGKFGAAASAYTRARRLTGGRRDDQARLLMKEGVIREHSGRYPQALRWYSRALAMDDRDRPLPERAELLIAYGGVRFRQGRFREAVRWCERAVEHAQAVGDRPGLAHAYYVLHILHMTLGTPEKETYRSLALPIYEELGDLTRQGYVLNNLGIDAYEEGQWDEAIGLYQRSREALGRAGAWVEAADTDNNIAEILSDQGRLDEAEGLVRESLRTHRAAEYPMGIAYSIQHLGRIRRAAAARRRPATCSPRRSICGSRSAVRPARPRPRRSWPRRCCSKATTPLPSRCSARRSNGDGNSPSSHGCGRSSSGSSAARWCRPAIAKPASRSAGSECISRASGSQFELAMGLDALARLHPGTPEAASGRHEADEVFTGSE